MSTYCYPNLLPQALALCLGCVLLAMAGPADARTRIESKTAAHKIARAPTSLQMAPAARVQATAPASKQSAAKNANPHKATQQLKRGRRMAPVVQAPMPPTLGESMGLHAVHDPLALSTGAALLINLDTREVVYAKNPKAVLPIASITKLMTALVVLESEVPLSDAITVTEDDIDTEKNSSSRLPVGTVLTRGEMLNLALMSSENRAAHALGRSQPEGLATFVATMNRRAAALGMLQTRFNDPTGLSDQNRSTPMDLSLLVKEAANHDTIRNLSTAQDREMNIRGRKVMYRNSNALVRSGAWDIVVQKTGYIKEAGRCVVMEIASGGQRWVMVLLDAASPQGRWSDARKLRDFGLAHATAAADAKARAIIASNAVRGDVPERLAPPALR